MPDSVPGDITTTFSLTIGGSLTGLIDETGDSDWYAVSLTAGRLYRFTLSGAATGGGTLTLPWLAIHDSAGNALRTEFGGNSSDPILDYSPVTTGTYFLSSRGSNTGTYSLSGTDIGADDHLGSTASTSSLVVGSTTSGDIQFGSDADWFRVDLAPGRYYAFELQGAASGGGSLAYPFLHLYDASGNTLIGAETGGAGRDARLTYGTSSGGTFFLSAHANHATSTGTYTLHMKDLGPDDYADDTSTSGTIPPDGSVNGNISAYVDRDWFRVDLAAGVFYAFDLKGAASGGGTLAKPWLELMDASGTLVQSAGGTGLDARISYGTTAGGTYFLSAGAGYGSGAGTYTLSLTTLDVDDYAGDETTTGVLTPGGLATGEIQADGDLDWFGIDLIAGRIYRFDLKGADSGGGTLGDPMLGVIGNENLGRYVVVDQDSGPGRDAQVFFNPSASGIRYLEVLAQFYTGTGSYTLTATDLGADDYFASALTSGSLVTGGTATGDIQYKGDVDWLRVELSAGRVYQFDIKGLDSGGGSLADPTLGLLDSSGAHLNIDLDSGTGRDAQLTYSPGTDGTYYLSVRDAAYTATGTYTASVTDLGADDYAANFQTSGSLAPGGTINGNIEFAGDADWFRIDLIAGRIYSIDARGFDSGGGTLQDPQLYLFDETGPLSDPATSLFLTWDWNNGTGRDARLQFRSNITSTGYFSVSSEASGGTGTYTLQLTDLGVDDHAGDVSTASAVPMGGTVFGAIQFGTDQDWFRVDLTAGHIYEFNLRGADAGGGSLNDPSLRLLDAAGESLAADHDPGSAGDGRVIWLADATGTHYLAAAAGHIFGPVGNYTLAATDLGSDDHAGSTATTSRLDPTSYIFGAIQYPQDQDWFRIDLEAGQTYVFHMRGADSGGGNHTDPYLRLLDASGNELAVGLDDSYRDEAAIVYTAPATATYYLSAEGGVFGWTLGSYTLSSSLDDYEGSAATTATGPAPGESVIGRIQYSGDDDWMRIELTAGEVYAFSLEGEAIGGPALGGPELWLMDGTGTLLVQCYGYGGDAALLGYIPETSGTYYLVAKDDYGSTGGYRLSSLADDYGAGVATTGSLAPGSSVRGSILVDEDQDWFRITLSAGTSYSFTLEGMESGGGSLADPLLRLCDASGNTIVSNRDGGIGTDAALTFIPTSTGTYYLSAEPQYGGGGSYTLSTKSLGSSYQATPVSNALALTGDPVLDGLIQGSKWNFTGAAVLTYSFNDVLDEFGNPFGGPWTDAQQDAMRGALSAWAAVTNLDFVEIPGSTTLEENTANLAFGHTGGLFSPASGLGILPDPGYVDQLLVELGMSRADYPLAEGDVVLDDYSSPMQYLDLGDAGFWVGLHELGHALGIKHPFDDGGSGRPTFAALGIGDRDDSSLTAMSYNTPEFSLTEGYPASPMLLDILAIQHLYGVNSDYHTEDNTYFLTWYSGLRTIWDAGGNDWLDASRLDEVMSAGVDLNLAPGSINRVNPLNTLAIAYGVNIENARGCNGSDTLRGTSSANILEGMASADTLLGAGGNDILLGGDGSDILDGGADADSLEGGAGNDLYFVDAAGDTVTELAGTDAGWDTVVSRVTYDLSANVENLVLNASACGRGLFGGRPRDIGVDGGGNDGDNLIVGNRAANRLAGGAGDDRIGAGAGDDLLIGGAGSDVLIGDRGRDTFLLDSLAGIDRIADFAAEDRLWFDHTVFGGLDLGALAQAAFASGAGLTAAQDADDRLIHDTASGALYYDSDGPGGTAAVQVAVLLTQAYGAGQLLGQVDCSQVWVI